jgi:hypothetical protein
MITVTRDTAIAAMIKHYPAARKQLSAAGHFGKTLDQKARKLALKMAGIELPEGQTIAWATPEGWCEGGYRSPGRPAEMESGKRVNVYLDGPSIERAKSLGDGNVSEGIRKALT